MSFKKNCVNQILNVTITENNYLRNTLECCTYFAFTVDYLVSKYIGVWLSLTSICKTTILQRDISLTIVASPVFTGPNSRGKRKGLIPSRSCMHLIISDLSTCSSGRVLMAHSSHMVSWMTLLFTLSKQNIGS